jgi:SAM-dependent methyltransferase
MLVLIQIEKAKANGLQDAFVFDLQEELRFPEGFTGRREGFDAVFSNATLHWCKRNPAFVLENAKRVLRPGGRIVVEMGGHLNVIGEDTSSL